MNRNRKVDLFEIGLGVQDPAVWMNDTFDVVANLTKSPFPKEKISRFELRLTESGHECANLILWDRDKKKILGWLEHPDLEEFLFRSLMRVVKP